MPRNFPQFDRTRVQGNLNLTCLYMNNIKMRLNKFNAIHPKRNLEGKDGKSKHQKSTEQATTCKFPSLLISKDRRSSNHQEPINPKNSLAKVESLHSLSDIFHLSRKNDKMIMTKSISIPNSRKELG